jgi:hypothetical protein
VPISVWKSVRTGTFAASKKTLANFECVCKK